MVCGRNDRNDKRRTSPSVTHNEARVGFKPHEKGLMVCVSPPSLCAVYLCTLLWVNKSRMRDTHSFHFRERKKITDDRTKKNLLAPSARAFNGKCGKIPKLNMLTVVSPEGKVFIHLFLYAFFSFFKIFPLSQWLFLIFKTEGKKKKRFYYLY